MVKIGTRIISAIIRVMLVAGMGFLFYAYAEHRIAMVEAEYNYSKYEEKTGKVTDRRYDGLLERYVFALKVGDKRLVFEATTGCLEKGDMITLLVREYKECEEYWYANTKLETIEEYKAKLTKAQLEQRRVEKEAEEKKEEAEKKVAEEKRRAAHKKEKKEKRKNSGAKSKQVEKGD